jgi:hypothetical protein
MSYVLKRQKAILAGRKCRAETAPLSLLKRTSLSKGLD